MISRQTRVPLRALPRPATAAPQDAEIEPLGRSRKQVGLDKIGSALAPKTYERSERSDR